MVSSTIGNVRTAATDQQLRRTLPLLPGGGALSWLAPGSSGARARIRNWAGGPRSDRLLYLVWRLNSACKASSSASGTRITIHR
jgi:hypothetical protein